MTLVKVKTRGQVTLPSMIREQAGLNVGDLLEAKVERGKITLTPKSLIDRRLEEGLEDFRKGRASVPFATADELIVSLKDQIKKRVAKRSRR